MSAISDRAFDRLAVIGAVVAAAAISFIEPGVGDYPTDAGPALSAIGHGNVVGFFAQQPAMGPLSMYIRAPFAALAVALHGSPLEVYRLGVLACMLPLAGVSVWLSRMARRNGAGGLAKIVVMGVCLLNPLVGDAIYWGHPEEILTGSLCIAALLAACERRGLVAAVFAGLAIASKQWALLILVPTIVLLERDRLRCACLSLTIAAAATVPMALANFAALRHVLSYISTAQPVVTTLNWLYPLSPSARVHVSNIFGDARTFSGHHALGLESSLSHPLIVVLGFALPLALWWRRGGRLRIGEVLLATAIVLLLRCTLDPSTAAYYHLPLLLVLVAWDATEGRRLPLAGLASWALSFIVLNRAASYLGPAPTSALYLASTLAALLVLVRALVLQRGELGAAAVPYGGRGWPASATASS